MEQKFAKVHEHGKRFTKSHKGRIKPPNYREMQKKNFKLNKKHKKGLRNYIKIE